MTLADHQERASEKIRSLTDEAKLNRDTEVDDRAFCYEDGAANMGEACFVLVETQERASAWTPFSERQPPSPEQDDLRTLLVRERMTGGQLWVFYPGWFVIGGFEREWRWVKNPRFSLEEFDRLNVLEWLIIEPFEKQGTNV